MYPEYRTALPDHPATSLIPALDDTAFEALVEAIRRHGQLTPIKLHGGQVIDGRSVLRACLQLGLTPRYETIHTIESPTAYVLSANVMRRHLTPAQRAAVAVMAKDHFAAEARERQRRHLPDDPSGTPRHEGEWSTRAAQAAGAGITATKTLDAIKRSAPEVFQAVHQGTIKRVEDAKRIAGLPWKDRARVLKALSSSPNLSVRTAIDQVQRRSQKRRHIEFSARGYRLLQGDLAEASAGIPDNSVDIVFADPPYDRKSLPIYKKLGELAVRVLRPGGSLLLMTGGCYLPEIFAELRRHRALRYQFELGYQTKGLSARIWNRRIFSERKPILWYAKGEYTGDFVRTDLVFSDKPEKSLHEWQQSESGMYNLLSLFAEAGLVVLDPCCGSGTTGVVAMRLGCRFIGIDRDTKAIEIARKRIDDLRLAA